jgi:glucose-6-phosphate isomerase
MWYERLRESEITDFNSPISDFNSEIHGLNINLVVESVRRDRIVVGATQHDDDQVNNLAGKTLPELNAAAIQAAKAADATAGRPSVDIRLPALDEGGLGQLFQMLMLAAEVERRLAGLHKRAPRSDRG